MEERLMKVQNNAKRKATEDISIRPSKIMNMVMRDAVLSATTQDLSNIRDSIYRSRRKLLPPLPKNLDDVFDALATIEIKTSINEDFLLSLNKELGIVIFSCEKNLQFLCSETKFFCDGTFNYCTKFFTQLFTIHVVRNGHYVPLVFALIKNKKTEAYEQVFRTVISACDSKNLTLNPSEIVCDFEEAIHKASRNVWPQLKITGCRFHISQAWLRKIQNIGLKREYSDKDSELGKWLRWSFGLIYLDSTDVSECFVEELIAEAPTIPV
uniref:Uncharacterized protein LOC114344197 n=1 Tax=Diabrotica virgifera virgifera TaxID=50390 RepID=A0A6P7GMH4_DIAVI